MKRLADFLFTRLWRWAQWRKPDRIIGAPGEDYLRRWYIVPRNRLLNIYLHQFLHSDDARALHDHPWVNVSFLLSGHYVEHIIKAGGIEYSTTYFVGDLKFRRAKTAHRIELADGECWSLFITGPQIREWGFHCRDRWVPWQQFSSPENPNHIGKGCDP